MYLTQSLRVTLTLLFFSTPLLAPPPSFLTANHIVKQGPLTVITPYCNDPVIDPIMTRLVYIESSNSARAVSSTGDYGLFQLNWPTLVRVKDQCKLTTTQNNLCVILSGIENPNALLDKEQNIKIACLLATKLRRTYGHEVDWFTRWNSNKPALRAKYLTLYNNF